MSTEVSQSNATERRQASSNGLRGQRVVLVTSPHAGHAAGANDVLSALQAQGVIIERDLRISELDPERPQGKAWKRAGIGGVVVAGGDGTVSGTLDQIAQVGLPLGILPLGTMNDVARSLGLPLDLAGAAAVVADGRLSTLDAGQAWRSPGHWRRYRGAHWKHGPTAYFLQALTLGLHEHFAEHAADDATRQTWGSLTAPVAALDALREARPIPVAMMLREVRWPVTAARVAFRTLALQVTVANMPRIGGPANIAIAGAAPDDHLLDVVVIEDPGQVDRSERVAGMHAALDQLKEGLLHRQHEGDPIIRLDGTLPGIRHFQARSLTLATPRPIPVALDGEPCAETPFEASAVPGIVQVLVPYDV